MGFPYVPVFLALLLAYMVYSQWARLDSRYPIAAALMLLVVTAVIDAAGAVAVANTLAEFVFFLLAGGVVLLLLDHARESRSPGPASAVGTTDARAPDAPQGGQGTADEPLERSEQQPVALVNAPRREYDEDE